MKVAAIQMTSGPDVAANLEQARALLDASARPRRGAGGAAGELRVHGLKDADKRAVGEAGRQRAASRTSWQPRRATSSCGSSRHDADAQAPDGRVSAASLVFDASGTARRALRQDPSVRRRHSRQGRGLSRVRARCAGARAAWSSIRRWARLGLSVCYDMRFPELFRRLSAAGAQIITRAVRVHRAHRARALGDAAARARHRESLLRHRAGAVRVSSERARNLRRQHDRRPLGRGTAALAPWHGLRGGRGRLESAGGRPH